MPPMALISNTVIKIKTVNDQWINLFQASGMGIAIQINYKGIDKQLR